MIVDNNAVFNVVSNAVLPEDNNAVFTVVSKAVLPEEGAFGL